MQHFLNFEKCNCGAYRYLAVREHKKSYEIYLIHHRHFTTGQDIRKYSKLASIPKFRINIHDQRTTQKPKEKTLKLRVEEISALKSVLKQLESEQVADDIDDLGDSVGNPVQYSSNAVEDPSVIETPLG